ncbi:bifunctional transcriptional activator/DNA repair enzyme AdaA [Bacillus cereus]
MKNDLNNKKTVPLCPENKFHKITNEQWHAIIYNDSSYDNKFYYGVKTTGIFCRPSCKSKIPKRDNVNIFKNAQEALSQNFRPCKRCKPTALNLPNEEWIKHITDYIDKNFDEPLTLERLASICHGSPFHLQRTFKKIKGLTPMEYIQQIRTSKAKYYLEQTNYSIIEIGLTVGIQNTAYFSTLFKKKTGYTPNEYRKLHQK